MSFKNIKIVHRLILGFGLLLMLMVGVTLIAHLVSQNLRESLNDTINRSNIKSSVSSSMRHALIRQGLLARGIGVSSSAEEVQVELQAIAAERITYQESEGKLLSLPMRPEEQAVLDEMKRYDAEVVPLIKEAENQLTAGKPGETVKILTKQVLPVHIRWLGAIDRLVEQQNYTIREQLRDFDEQSDRATAWMASVCAVSLALAIAVGFFITRSIARPVRQLIAFSKKVAAGDLSARNDRQGTNEIAVLAAAMDGMAESLQASQAQLIDAARVAGMAEIATNVLHNVGNVLNSVNVSAGVIGARVRDSKAKGLQRAVALIDAHEGNLGQFFTADPKGKLFPAYLRELAKSIEQEQASLNSEILALGKSVDHIKEVIATQQSYAGTARIVETLKVEDLVEDALRISASALTRHRVQVERNLDALPALPLDRHRVLQIMVNLITNAKQAIDAGKEEAPKIVISARLLEERTLRLTVTDNGVGIPPDNLTRIFSHGFTTKADGHGFGLHSCVLSAQEMGGRLTANSDGAGKGATFQLDLPIV